MRVCHELPLGTASLAASRLRVGRARGASAPAPPRRSPRAAAARAAPPAASSDAPQPPAPPPPAPGIRLSRRAASAAFSLVPLLAPLLARAADAGDEAEDEAAAAAAMAAVLAKQPAIGGFQTLSASIGGRSLSFEVPAAWKAEPPRVAAEPGGFTAASFGALTDPVVGAAADEATLRVRPAPPGVATVADLGPQEDIAPATLLGLADVVPELKRADIMRAGKRIAAVTKAGSGAESGSADAASPPSGPLFYDWELAVPPEYCAYNTGCNSAAVYFVSVTVSGGQLCVLSLKQTDEAQYRANAGALRRARTTFTVADALPAIEPPRAPAAEPSVIIASP